MLYITLYLLLARMVGCKTPTLKTGLIVIRSVLDEIVLQLSNSGCGSGFIIIVVAVIVGRFRVLQ